MSLCEAMRGLPGLYHQHHGGASRIATVQEFKELTNFYRRFIPRYSAIVLPLTHLLRENGKHFIWDDNPQQAFKELKARFSRAPILRHFNSRRRIRVETDVSQFAIAAILL
jgi:RNase H-like domain found in reverse transcriptase